jgi:Family of unknown function (DUF5681)
MIKRIRRHARAAQKACPQSRLGASYSVGYGKPPRQHQFEPGESGNRKGRPKGKKNSLTLLREILDRKIEVRIGGKLRKMSVREAILTRFAEAALKGDTKAAAFLLQQYDKLASDSEHTNNATTPEEQEIIDAYLQDFFKNGRKKK